MNTKNIAQEIKKLVDKMPVDKLYDVKKHVDKICLEAFAEDLVKNRTINQEDRSIMNIPSTQQFTFNIDDITFSVPTQSALIKLGLDTSQFCFNKHGLLLYWGEKTKNYVDKIASVCRLDAEKIIFPTKNQAQEICNNPNYKNALVKAEICYIPFIIDKNDENRNVSSKEFWQNPDKYSLCYTYVEYGNSANYDPLPRGQFFYFGTSRAQIVLHFRIRDFSQNIGSKLPLSFDSTLTGRYFLARIS